MLTSSCARCQGVHFQGYKVLRGNEASDHRALPLGKYVHCGVGDAGTGPHTWALLGHSTQEGKGWGRTLQPRAVWPDTEVASTCALNKQKLDPFILVRFYPSLLRQYGLKYKEGSLMYFKYTVNSKIMWEYFSTLIFWSINYLCKFLVLHIS